MTERTIRVGFVGAGANTRRHHIPKLRAQPGVELMAVANRTKESGERIAHEFGIARVHRDWRELVRAPDLDAICIGTWPNTHCEITRAVLEHGKHVLCEARMAMNVAEARSMLDAARGAPHLVAQLVPAPNTLEVDATLQALLAEGYVGDVLAVEIQANQGRFVDADEPLHWRHDAALSGLNVMTMGIWYEALMRWLGPARRVTAMTKIAVPRRRDAAGAWQEVRLPDHVEILATLSHGAVAHMRFSTVTALAPPSEVYIFGTEGTIRIESEARRLSGGRRGDTGLREIAIPAERRIGWRVEEEFVNAIRGREKVTRTTFEDGVRYMEFTEAVWQSAAGGQTVDVAEL
jgi:predicted dehydrogenase